MSTSTTRVIVIRNTAAAVTLVAVAVLGLVAAESGGTVVHHTVVTKHEVKVEARAPKAAPPAQATAAAPSVPATSPVSDPAVVPATASVVAVAPVTSATSTPTTTTPTAASTTPATTTTTGSTGSTITSNVIPACPLGLAAPTQNGGLQSLIGFAPLFGPFSSEAFAMAPSFQPVLELIGPFLTAFANYYAPEAPAIQSLLNAVDALETKGYTVLTPLYGPYRTAFLTAETELATALAPGASTLVENPAASCVIDIENFLTTGH